MFTAADHHEATLLCWHRRGLRTFARFPMVAALYAPSRSLSEVAQHGPHRCCGHLPENLEHEWVQNRTQQAVVETVAAYVRQVSQSFIQNPAGAVDIATGTVYGLQCRLRSEEFS